MLDHRLLIAMKIHIMYLLLDYATL